MTDRDFGAAPPARAAAAGDAAWPVDAAPAAWPPPPSGPPPVPDPPPGPGVQPPFVAAPIEGRRARTWLGLGLAGAVLAVCCGVGVVAVGGLLVLGEQAINEQAQRAVADYLAAVAEEDWEQAYDQRCEQDRRAESLPAFTSRASAEPAIESYQVGDLQIEPGNGGLEPGGGEMTVPVFVTYAGGASARLIFPVDQSSRTGRFEVCGTVQPG
ncbi:MAG: hypothetical protein GEV12_00910 [Micromonosporaceae bacterium]|nr:hypothetical protein [Micromonosporaceae bacterium]